jgi:hypothetical protein
MAPEFAPKPGEEHFRREPALVPSHHTVSDVWHRGHTKKEVKWVRGKYFWITDLLRSNEKYFMYDPDRVSSEYATIAGYRVNPFTVDWGDFRDIDYYRASAEMITHGTSLLNEYYRNWMEKRYNGNRYVSDNELRYILEIIECLAGIYGIRPTMMPYMPDLNRELFLRVMRRADAQNARDELQMNREWMASYTRRVNTGVTDYFDQK